MSRLLNGTFTTAAFDRSSFRLFEASSYKAAPKGLPSSLVQHRASWRVLDTMSPRAFRALANRQRTKELVRVCKKLPPRKQRDFRAWGRVQRSKREISPQAFVPLSRSRYVWAMSRRAGLPQPRARRTLPAESLRSLLVSSFDHGHTCGPNRSSLKNQIDLRRGRRVIILLAGSFFSCNPLLNHVYDSI